MPANLAMLRWWYNTCLFLGNVFFKVLHISSCIPRDLFLLHAVIYLLWLWSASISWLSYAIHHVLLEVKAIHIALGFGAVSFENLYLTYIFYFIEVFWWHGAFYSEVVASVTNIYILCHLYGNECCFCFLLRRFIWSSKCNNIIAPIIFVCGFVTCS